jgi:hypothetical protein
MDDYSKSKTGQQKLSMKSVDSIICGFAIIELMYYKLTDKGCRIYEFE